MSMESKQIIDNRQQNWLYTLKGFLTILVVLGHVVNGYCKADTFPANVVTEKYIYNFIYLFHMPVFFVISGYLFEYAYHRFEILDYDKIKIQIGNLCWNYILWSILFGLFKIIFLSNVNRKILPLDFLLIPLKAIDLYWYVYVLICMYLISILFEKLKLNTKWIIVCSGLLCVFQHYIVNVYDITIVSLLHYFFFFVFGRLYSSIKNKIKRVSVVFTSCICLGAMWYVLFIRQEQVNWQKLNFVGGDSAFFCHSTFLAV